MRGLMKKLKLILLAAALIFSAQTQTVRADSSSSFLGPSIGASLGIRSKKAPNLDTYYSTVGGIKIMPFSIMAGNALYISFIGIGLNYAGYGIFAPSLSPIMFFSTYGIGFSFDFFTVRDDRDGGPLGMSITFDIPRIIGIAMGTVNARGN